MSETRRIFTHPSVRQSGDYYDQYTETAAHLVCRTCGSPWADHNGWSCDGHSITVLPLDMSKLTKTPKPTGASFDYVTVATTKCAACSVLFTADADERLIAAHAKVCDGRPLEAGDYVRWDWNGDWCEGKLAASTVEGIARVDVTRSNHHEDVGCEMSMLAQNVRRIPRPVAEVKAEPQFVAPKISKREMEAFQAYIDKQIVYAYQSVGVSQMADKIPKLPTIETPALHDGMSTMECYRKWCDNRALVERGGVPLYALTPAQITAGRAAYLSDAFNEHSAELRLKLAAQKERERMQVVVDQDAEVGPW